MRGVAEYVKHLRMLTGSVWAYLVAVFLMGVGHSIFRVLRNQYVVDLGLDPSDYTSIQGFNSIGGLLIAIPAIVLIGRFRARTLLIGIALVNGLAFAIQGVTGSLEVFRGAAFAAGIAQSLAMALGAPFLMRNTGIMERIYAFSFLAVVAFPLSGVVGSLLSGEIQSASATWAGDGVQMFGEFVPAKLFGYQIALLVAAGFMLVALVPILFIRKEHQPDMGRKARDLLRVTGKSRAFFLCLPEMIIGFGAGLTIPYFNVYFKEVWNQDPQSIGYIFMAMMAVGVLSFLLAPSLVKRFGPVKVIVGSQLLSLPFFVELALENYLWLAIIAFILRNNLMNLAQPVIKQFAQEVSLPQDRHSISTLIHTSRHIFWTAANFVAGPLIELDNGGFRIVIVSTIVCYIVAISVNAVVFPKLNKLREEPVTPDT